MLDTSPGTGCRRRRARVHALGCLVALGVQVLGASPVRADVAGSIALVHPDGSGFTIVAPTVLAESLDWSPDGTRLAFEDYAGGNADIFVVGADGSGLRRLTADPGDELRPRWIDDARLTFERRIGEDDTEVYQMYGDGSGTSLLLTLPGRNLDWSPDRSALAFSSRRAGDADIWTMRADGSGLRQVTDLAGVEDDPVWSPDGSRIAFDRWDGAGTDIYVVDAAGTRQTRLTFSRTFNGLPDWSPDGDRIAFYGTGDDGDADIHVLDVDTGAVARVTDDPDTVDGGPVWSPDGSRIAFVRHRGTSGPGEGT